MRHDKKMESRRERPVCADEAISAPRNPVSVDWHDCAWSPQIVVQAPSRTQRRFVTKRLPAPPQILHTPRRNPVYFKTMKTILPSSRRHRAGFTLVELLVVIAIIGILATMLLPAISYAVQAAKKKKALIEEQAIATAIEGYDSAYGRFPVSSAAQAAAGTGDYTYGAVFQKPGGTANLLNPTYAMSNSEVIAILMDYTNYPNGSGSTINTNYQKNPQQRKFLNATVVGDPTLPGVGPDLVYRDPWGNPYVISMDLNYDDQCKDAFYSSTTVSGPSGNSSPGLNGLINPNASADNFLFHGTVMVWSAGPDKAIDPASAANVGANKDNVVSWQQ
jgi:prepilin-type N-terminal cleavage/methylation domain-containing protein